MLRLTARLLLIGAIMSGCMYESTTGAQPTTSDDAVPFQVYLEGNSIPFDVTTDEDLGPMMLGEQGPPPTV